MIRQHPTQMMQPRLTTTIRERLQRRHPQPIHTPNIHHPCRIPPLAPPLQHRRQQPRNSKHPLQIQRQHPLPRALRVLIIRRPPVAPAVIHEHVELRFPFRELLREPDAFLLVVEVRGDGVRGPGAEGVEFVAGTCAGGGVPGGDVHFGAGAHVAFGDHAADAFCAAGYEDGFVVDGEEVGGVHGERGGVEMGLMSFVVLSVFE